MRDESWMQLANCKGAPKEWFFPPIYQGTSKAELDLLYAKGREVCATCRVKGLCRDYSIRAKVSDGLWAGLTPEDRRKIRNNRKRGSPKADDQQAS